MADRSERLTISAHPAFDEMPADEIRKEIKELEQDIVLASKLGDKLIFSWKLQEKRFAEAALARRNGNAPPAEQEDFWPVPQTIREFNSFVDDEERWLWDNLVPFGEVAMLCGEPRAGKTTMALNLALAIARGYPFLQRKTTKSVCLYISIDNSRRDMKTLLTQLGCTDNDQIFLHYGKIPVRSVDWCLDMAVRVGARFVVIDTLERFFERYEINKPDFAKAMAPMDLEIKRLGITPLYVHHATAHPGLDSKIGSMFMGHTTVKAMTPYYLELLRVGESRHRVLSTDLRSGTNIAGMYVKLDRTTGWAMKGGRIEDALLDETKEKILAAMSNIQRATRGEIREMVEGRKEIVNIAITKLLDDGLLERIDPLINTGKAHHPEILTLAMIIT